MQPIHDPVRLRTLKDASREDVRWAERIEAVSANGEDLLVVLFERLALTPTERLEVRGRGHRVLQIVVDKAGPEGVREAQDLVLAMRFERSGDASGQAAARSSASSSGAPPT